MFRSLCIAAMASCAVASLPAASLIHNYLLNNTFADSLGGPVLTPNGGAIGPNGYTFAAQQGLDVAGVFPDDTKYSILLHYMFSAYTGTSGYNKLIDFTDLEA